VLTLLALVFGIAIIAMAAKLRGRGHRRAGRFKCHDCQHLRRTFDDGVMCGYGSREVFKTRAHISMCPDWSPAERRR
jgi:hypothetical protein